MVLLVLMLDLFLFQVLMYMLLAGKEKLQRFGKMEWQVTYQMELKPMVGTLFLFQVLMHML